MMEKKNYLTLDNEFIQYCKLNNINDIEKFARNVFNQGFTIIKYGEKPMLKQQSVKEEPKVEISNKKNIDDKSIYDE